MKNQSGQVLLIVIMLLATVMTVVLTVTFRSTTETQVTKMEEESQKALAAAEAAIEASLKSKGAVTLGQGDLSNVTGFTGGATIETATKPTFVTSLLEKDEQYIFYLANYNFSTNQFSNQWSGNLTIYFDSENNCPVIELTSIRPNNTVGKNILEPPSPCTDRVAGNSGAAVVANSSSIENTRFYYKMNPVALANYNILIVRPLFNTTRVAFEGNINLRPQGKVISSSAQSTTGVTKKVELFQSYPQIPADFFVTRF